MFIVISTEKAEVNCWKQAKFSIRKFGKKIFVMCIQIQITHLIILNCICFTKI